MYIPEVFQSTDKKQMIAFMESHSFADLVTFHQSELNSNKVPLFYDSDDHCLYGHLAKNNLQLAGLEETSDVLVIFSGAQSYISPRYYASENMVPTWNFQTLQVRGRPSLVDEMCLMRILNKLSRLHEGKVNNPWTMAEVKPEILKMMFSHIVGFKIDIADIQFKEKLSQNRTREDQLSVINALSQSPNAESKRIAELMLNNLSS